MEWEASDQRGSNASVHERLRTASEDTGLALKKGGGPERLQKEEGQQCGGDSEDAGRQCRGKTGPRVPTQRWQ